MKRKQPTQKPAKFQKPLPKKKTQINQVEDLTTHEEKELEQVLTQEPKQIIKQLKQQIQEEDDDEEENYEIEDIKKSAEKKQNSDKMAEIVLSLFHKNKINDKNAFDIPMINIKDLSVFSLTDQQSENAWKNISANLDAGSKIYGYRVDMVHQNTYKVLGGIHRTSTNFEDDQQQAEGQEQEQEQIRKRKIINTGGESTLEKNMSNIETNKYDMEYEIDPLFQQTSAKFDEAGAKGLLLNNLSVKIIQSTIKKKISDNLILALDSDLLNSNPNKSEVQANKNFNSNLVNYLKNNIKTILQAEICPELSQFRQEILQRGSELLDLKKIGSQFTDVMTNKSQVRFTQYEAMQDEQYEDDEQQFLREVDQIQGSQKVEEVENQFQNADNESYQGDLNNDIDDYQPIDFKQQSANFPETQRPRTFNISNFEGVIQSIGNGQVFQNDGKMDFFNFDLQRKSKKKQINLLEKPKVSKQKQISALPFSFTDNESISRAILQKKKHEIQLQYKDQKNLFLVPSPFQIDRRNFFEYFQRGSLIYNQSIKNENLQDDQLDIEVLDEGQDMPELPEQDDAILPQNFQGFSQNLQNNPVNLGLNRNNIPIKELKIKMWSYLKQILNETNSKDGIDFTQITNNLPEVLQISENKMKVSVQTSFVTILHLANEENLKFISNHNESDFRIQKDRSGTVQ